MIGKTQARSPGPLDLIFANTHRCTEAKGGKHMIEDNSSCKMVCWRNRLDPVSTAVHKDKHQGSLGLKSII